MTVATRGVCSKVTVEPVLFLYMLGIYLLYGVIQDLIYQKVCLENFSPDECGDALQDSENEDNLHVVQTEASQWIQYSTFMFVIPSIIVDCYMGSWSDKFGRKLTLVLPPTGAFLSSIVYSIMVVYPSSNVAWILLASGLQGIFGAFSSLLTGVLAYISAITRNEDRTYRFSILVSMSFVAGLVGPILSTTLATNFTHLLVFVLIACCHLAAVLYTVCFVREINEERNTANLTLSDLFSLQHLTDSFKTVFMNDKPKIERYRLVLLFATAFVLMTLQTGELDIAYLFMASPPLNISLTTFGIWFGLRYGLGSLALLLVLPLLKGAYCDLKCSISDGWTCAVGLFSKAAALVILGLSYNVYMVFAEVAVGSLSQFALTALRSMISQSVEEKEQGKLLGLFAVFEDLSVLSGAFIFNSIYPLTRPYMPGIPFLASAVVIILIILPSVVVTVKLDKIIKKNREIKNSD